MKRTKAKSRANSRKPKQRTMEMPKSPGRPPTRSMLLPKYRTMTQCVGATGIPMEVLKKAKGDGNPAFGGDGTVDLQVLLPSLFKPDQQQQLNLAPGKGSRSSLDFWRSEREKIKFLKESGEVADRGVLRSGLQAAQSEFFSSLERVFCSELPPAIMGMRELELRNRFKQEIEIIKAALRARFDAMANDASATARNAEMFRDTVPGGSSTSSENEE
jgi:hypothetical protein